jgi:hypothetical protein
LRDPNIALLISRKALLAAQVLCALGIVLLLDSLLRSLFVVSVGSSSAFYVGVQGAFLPFENLEGILGALLAINPLFILAYSRA